MFDDPNLVSCAGLAPVWQLAQRAGLPGLVLMQLATSLENAGWRNDCAALGLARSDSTAEQLHRVRDVIEVHPSRRVEDLLEQLVTRFAGGVQSSPASLPVTASRNGTSERFSSSMACHRYTAYPAVRL